MATDEIECNAFYHILQSKFRKKYEEALLKCWMMCIPCTAALRGINITEEFVDLHILRPSKRIPSMYLSTDPLSTYSFELRGSNLTLQQQSGRRYNINILSVENGYNKDLQPFKILIVDKPLVPKYSPKPIEDSILPFQKIVSLNEATAFLMQFPLHREPLLHLEKDLQQYRLSCPLSLQTLREQLRSKMGCAWMTLLKTHPLDHQRDARFQHLLSVALENFIMSRVHEVVYGIICAAYEQDDAVILTQVKHLATMKVTADQLGIPEDFAVPLPAAVVELASLDSLNCPVDKLSCLRTTLDLILAELKGAIVDAQSLLSEERELPTLATDDLIPLLVTVIIQAKPMHMMSNLFYMDNFQWTLSPNDAVSFSLVTFKAAIQELLSLKPDQLRPRSGKVHKELGLEDLLKVTAEVGQRFKSSGKRREEMQLSPLDRQMERITAMIEASTRELSAEDVSIAAATTDVDADKNSLGALLSCFRKQEEG